MIDAMRPSGPQKSQNSTPKTFFMLSVSLAPWRFNFVFFKLGNNRCTRSARTLSPSILFLWPEFLEDVFFQVRDGLTVMLR